MWCRSGIQISSHQHQHCQHVQELLKIQRISWNSGFFDGFPLKFRKIIQVFPWSSYGLPMVFQWSSHRFPMVFPWFSSNPQVLGLHHRSQPRHNKCCICSPPSPDAAHAAHAAQRMPLEVTTGGPSRGDWILGWEWLRFFQKNILPSY